MSNAEQKPGYIRRNLTVLGLSVVSAAGLPGHADAHIVQSSPDTPAATALNVNKPPSPGEVYKSNRTELLTKVTPLKEAIYSGKPVMWDGAILVEEAVALPKSPVIFSSLNKNPSLRISGTCGNECMLIRPVFFEKGGHQYAAAVDVQFLSYWNGGDANAYKMSWVDFSMKNNSSIAWQVLDLGLVNKLEKENSREVKVTYWQEKGVEPILRKVSVSSAGHLMTNDPRTWEWNTPAEFRTNYGGPDSVDNVSSLISALHLSPMAGPPSFVKK